MAEISQRGSDTKSFTFSDPEYQGTYDFLPGQFLTLKVDPDGDGLTAPRHYTVTSAPGEATLQCTVKRIGKVSGYIHSRLHVGERVQLAPPYGVFTPSPSEASVVLISAGIGVTPMLNFSRHFGSKVALVAHVAKSPEHHVFLEEFQQLGCQVLTHYTSQKGRPKVPDFISEVLSRVGVSHGFYLCAPPQFMEEARAALLANSVAEVNIHSEAFGPKLAKASGCPLGYGSSSGGGGSSMEPVGHKGSSSSGNTPRKRDGECVRSYKDGSKYQGQLRDGKRHGKGRWEAKSGAYEGEWQTDMQHGVGHQTWADGRSYQGQFLEGKFHGQGSMEWKTPQGVMKFDGQYVRDVKHGVGKFYWPDGRVYDGEWQNGKRWGKAAYINHKGERKLGLWNDDKLERWLDGGASAAAGESTTMPSSSTETK